MQLIATVFHSTILPYVAAAALGYLRVRCRPSQIDNEALRFSTQCSKAHGAQGAQLVPLPNGSGNRSEYASVGASGCRVGVTQGRRWAAVSGNGRKWEWPDRDTTHMLRT